MLYFILILIALWLLWPWISKWISGWTRRFMARRAEDMMRRMMGMPSRKEEERRARKQQKGSDSRSDSGWKGFGKKHRRHRAPTVRAATLLREVAVDVEFVEIKEFESVTINPDRKQARIYREEQVVDVEYTEYKISKS